MSDVKETADEAEYPIDLAGEPTFKKKDTEKLKRLSLELRALTQKGVKLTDSTIYLRKMRDSR